MGYFLASLLWLAAGTAIAEVADSEYRLGPGDQIIIQVFGEQDLSMNIRLNDTGRLNYPFLGELAVEGLATERSPGLWLATR